MRQPSSSVDIQRYIATVHSKHSIAHECQWEDSMQPARQIQRFPWGTADDAQVLIVHFGSKSTPMIAQLLRQIGLRGRVIDAADVPAVAASGYHPKLVILSGGDDSVANDNAPTIADRDLATFTQHGVVLGICYGAQ